MLADTPGTFCQLLLIAIVSIAGSAGLSFYFSARQVKVTYTFSFRLFYCLGSRPGYNSRRLKISTKEEPCLISSADKSVQEMDRLFDEIDCKSYPRVACGSLASHEQQSSSNINLTTLLNLRCLDRAMSLHSRRGGRRAFAWLGRADDLEAQA
ncbi:uncharacterized protein LOC9648036 [Selaginella moellendorffii]|uniref:uncharacterized protein LOC9648036 n=1 Tax=Selaginella moellendorffii TaxID=88036 RepID=UPI000D1C2B83|nr:uncharacterized protein LOC9648036 [Selaginella moellendorffii]XP_024541126.1 uncharacterized protein LOC9648036 [Selaginella moellendorffii]|eukprot:XP_024541125.1 uncharacterized protein LOC9648036 [Selaginella moellendorffii]